MSIKDLAAQFTLPERHKQLTPLRVSIEGYVRFDRELVASLKELEDAHPSKTRPLARDGFGR